ncbi:hypothetical protein [uncultured Mediterranean phage uvMED]|nr:hypothetical protein [uncultured Mediterranean phage uvMED]
MKKWLNRISQYARDHGSFPVQNQCDYQLHHVIGRKGTQGKVKIGQWFVLPVDVWHHDVHKSAMASNPYRDYSVTHFPRKYREKYGLQRDQFLKMVESIEAEDGFKWVPDDVLEAIRITSR